MVPYNIKVSREGNFFARALDISALDRKFDQWRQSRRDWLDNWDSPDDFYTDVQLYLTNLAQPTPEPSAKIFGETKRNILNEFLGARGRKGVNPLALEKMAEKEFLVRSFRLDRIASLNLDNAHETFPFSEVSYQLNKANFMPDEMPKSLVDMNQARDGNVSTETVEITDSFKFMPELIDQKFVDPKAIKGKKAFFMFADRMKVGTHTTRSGKVYNLRGGSDHPDIVDNMGRVAWAVDGGGVATGLEKAINSTDGIGIVLLMKEEAVSGNADFAAMMLDEISYEISNSIPYKKLFPHLLKNANASIRKTAYSQKISTLNADNRKLPAKERLSTEEIESRAQKAADNIKPLKSLDDIKGKYRKMPFPHRSALFKQLAPSNSQLNKLIRDKDLKIDHKFAKSEAIFWKDLVSDIIDRKESDGWRQGDVTKIIQFKKGSPIKTPKETGTPAHTSYDLLVEGESLGNPKGFVNVIDLLKEDLKIIEGGKHQTVDGDYASSYVIPFLQKNVLGDKDKGLNPVLRADSFTPKGKKGMLRFKASQKAGQDARIKTELDKRRQANEKLGGKYNKGIYMPEVDGKPVRADSELLLQSLLDGTLDPDPVKARAKFDRLIDEVLPIASVVDIPKTKDIYLTRENMEKLKMVMQEDQIPLIGVIENLQDGLDVGLRIDINAYNRSVELVEKGVLEKPVYAVTVHASAKKKTNDGEFKKSLGKRLGYDVYARVGGGKFKEGGGFRFHITSQKAAARIGTGEINKTTIATAEGKLIKSKVLPSAKELRTWAQIGMNPKRHGYFYDRSTGQAVQGGDEAISFGNTVFVKNPVYYSKAETLSLFTYMPEALGKSEITKTDDGYKAIKRDGKTRVYSPRGKLIGVASSEKVADSIYRRHNARTVSVR